MNDIIKMALSKCDDRTGSGVLNKKVIERFLTYVSFDTQSDEESETFPSAEKEKDLGRYLENEFKEIGLSDVAMDDYGYVYATLPASTGKENNDVLAFIAHMDVADAAPADDIHTIISTENGKNVIRTDRRTLLGADDKAGLAEMVTAVEEMLGRPEIKHPTIRLVVTPDEEVGQGTKYIDMNRVAAKYAYTIDGEALGELNYETWNGSCAIVEFTGVSIHPGIGYKILKNAAIMAAEFVNSLPEDETPTTTKDRVGFYFVSSMKGENASAQVRIELRDFEKDGLQKKKDFVISLVDKINEKYGDGSCRVKIEDTYPNMKEYIMPQHEYLVQRVRDCYKACGVELIETSVRGGTDGSTLSQMGLPTPNLGTGALACHSVDEHIAVEDMEKMVEVIIDLSTRF